jgi:hypothetical protein
VLPPALLILTGQHGDGADDHYSKEQERAHENYEVYERTVFAPIWQLAFLNGVGPRVGESGFGRIARFPYTAPYEDITLKSA